MGYTRRQCRRRIAKQTKQPVIRVPLGFLRFPASKGFEFLGTFGFILNHSYDQRWNLLIGLLSKRGVDLKKLHTPTLGGDSPCDFEYLPPLCCDSVLQCVCFARFFVTGQEICIRESGCPNHHNPTIQTCAKEVWKFIDDYLAQPLKL